MTTLNIRLIGHGLRHPGRDDPDGLRLGIQRKAEVVDVMPRSASSATFSLSVDVIATDSGELDVRGLYVHGPRGDRFLYLSWGKVDRNGTFGMVQRMKIKLGAIDPALIERALESGATLDGTFSLTNQVGHPLSGTVRPELIEWSVVFDADPG